MYNLHKPFNCWVLFPLFLPLCLPLSQVVLTQVCCAVTFSAGLLLLPASPWVEALLTLSS